MADWRQIQARIRKARNSDDPPGKLAELYQKTRDAMVAFELGRVHEKAGQNQEAVRWYTVAVERFRRAQWKTKAQEALARLSGSVPAPAEPEHASSAEPAAPAWPDETAGKELETGAWTDAQIPPASEPGREAIEPAAEQLAPPVESGAEIPGGAALAQRHRRRRGRRGGRRHRRAKGPEARSAAAQSSHAAPGASAGRLHTLQPPPERAPQPPLPDTPGTAHAPEPAIGPIAWQVRSRAGEPALASRLAHLESQLRRLISSPLFRLDEADQAPAGPGVFIVSDADHTTYYHIEACQTLRVGVANLLRGERGARRGESLRSRFADHLGISEARVSKYLKEHCAVRWLQLDEGAGPLAHFAIAVLRPALDE